MISEYLIPIWMLQACVGGLAFVVIAAVLIAIYEVGQRVKRKQ